MILTFEVRQAINGPWPKAEERRRSQLRGDLDAFVQGGLISIADHPYDKLKTAYLARVDPVEAEIWDIRSIDPSPSIRVLGSFAETDVFVALVWAYRKDLDGPGGPLWGAFIDRAKHAWRSLFQDLKPHSGSNISDYVSDRFFAV